ncbi:hypothetical protein Tco_0719992 [Tanacetum coccineum]
MNPVATQQAALDNALVPPEKRLKIERCNARIAFSKPQREETYQVTLEALKLSSCYLAFLITAEPWRTFAATINMCISRKTTGLDRLRDIHELNLRWGYLLQSDRMLDCVALLRFTKVIIDHFISKDKTISMSNRINLHTLRDDSLLGTDISKIIRKPSRTGKHGHEKRKSSIEAKDAKPNPEKVNLQSTMGQS